MEGKLGVYCNIPLPTQDVYRRKIIVLWYVNTAQFGEA